MPAEKTNEINYISVTELNRILDWTLSEQVGEVFFEGEISQVTRAASGHLYFLLKDEESQVAAVMWRGPAAALSFAVEAGTAVLCHAQPNVYHKSGKLQMIVHRMLPAGEGDLRRKFLELKQKLEKEGLFAPERKRPLPFLPAAVGLVTSSTGAVVHDIMVKIRERMPSTRVFLVDVRVQGEGAAEEIARGVDRLSDSGLVDVIVVARGGGSLQDLWAFNEETVVRAIFRARVPVVSGVGHEVDVTLSDLAADERAPTPTAAAELVVPKRGDLLAEIADFERRLYDTDRWFQPLVQGPDELSARLDQRIKAVCAECRLHLQAAEAKLRAVRPENVLAMFGARVTLLWERLCGLAGQRAGALGARLDLLQTRLERALSPDRFGVWRRQVAQSESRLGAGAERSLWEARHRLEKLSVRLESISPRRVLDRGFALVQHQGRVIKSSADLKLQDTLRISFASGGVKAAVTEKI